MTSVMRRVSAGAIGLAAVATSATLVSAAPAGAATHSTTTNSTTAARPMWSSSLRWPTVRPGTAGERVFAIQYLLQARGYHLRADGRFGAVTARDVRSFQRSRGIGPSGHVGPQTWPRLIITVQRGNSGSAVRAVQHSLRFAYGFRFQGVNGFFGRATQTRVFLFQRNSRLRADGVVGSNTWKTMVVFEH
jgi:peptidoglycan hydrolase-like protein with peptidoglycan-binding domain